MPSKIRDLKLLFRNLGVGLASTPECHLMTSLTIADTVWGRSELRRDDFARLRHFKNQTSDVN